MLTVTNITMGWLIFTSTSQITKTLKYPLIAYTITPTHFGIGRAPSIVDLPIARDPLGYPIMPSSGVKGALKSRCGRKYIENGRINCSEGKRCCCLYGPEPGESEKGGSAAALTDFVLLAAPVPSPTHGWVYVSSPYLLLRISALLNYLGASDLASSLRGLAEAVMEGGPVFLGEATEVKVLGKKFSTKPPNDEVDLSKLQDEGLASELSKKLLVVPDRDAPSTIDKGVIRYWRVRLRYDTKTVDQRMLWSEEYLPAGTIFVGGIALTQRRNSYCLENNKDKAREYFKQEFSEDRPAYLFLGGKEGIGKGLVKIRVLLSS